MPRAKKPYGFELWEGWADALGWEDSPRRDMAFWLYQNAITGVRIMVKFADIDDHWYDKVLRKHEIAKGLGLETMLCIDWFNRAGGPGSYHRDLERPRLSRIPSRVRNMLVDFKPDMVEVCNEPYYAKRQQDRVNHDEYRSFVEAYVEGCDMANYDGIVVASQPNEKFTKPGDVHDAWVWHVNWPKMLEGDHSAVLHDCSTLQCLTNLVDDWQGGRPIGYVHQHFETECTPLGRATADSDPHAYTISRQFTEWAMGKKLPYCWLAMGGSPPNEAWDISTRLITENGILTNAAIGVLDAMGIDIPDNPGPPDPPDPPSGREYPGARWAYKAINRVDDLDSLAEAKKDKKFNRYLKKWHQEWSR